MVVGAQQVPALIYTILLQAPCTFFSFFFGCDREGIFCVPCLMWLPYSAKPQPFTQKRDSQATRTTGCTDESCACVLIARYTCMPILSVADTPPSSVGLRVLFFFLWCPFGVDMAFWFFRVERRRRYHNNNAPPCLSCFRDLSLTSFFSLFCVLFHAVFEAHTHTCMTIQYTSGKLAWFPCAFCSSGYTLTHDCVM